jgi:multidrug efflux pump subunit AcrB
MENGTQNFNRGPVAWMVHNRVTPNLLMLFLIVGGLFMSTKIKQEVFPEFSLDMVNIRISYPGASPEEVEQGIILSVEEAIRGLEGIKEIQATANEGSANINAELMEDADQQKVYNEIKQEIDRIQSFPEDAERPTVTLVARKQEVLTLQLYGNVNEWQLREVSESVRDRLLQHQGISQLELSGDRDYEIQINIKPETLRSYNLTLEQIAQRISQNAVEIPGGSVKTAAGEILVRLTERRDWAYEFGSIPVQNTPTGSNVLLGDIADIKDTFVETDKVATFNGQPTIGIDVYRIGNQTPIGVSDAVKEVMQSMEAELPVGIEYQILDDGSDVYRQRIELLLRNAFQGLILVMICLSLFLEVKLAFWVMMGIPISFLGGMLFFPGMDVSINMISLFAFIISLGIVVDDAIVAGENIYEYRQKGMSAIEAAIKGAGDVATPIAFSILTNIVTFIPLYFVPGYMGKIWKVIPVVVGTVFLISWFEALFILPAHLAYSKLKTEKEKGFVEHLQDKIAAGLKTVVNRFYIPVMEVCLKYRYITTAIGMGSLIVIIGYVASGRMSLTFMPKVESDKAVVNAEIPFGSPISKSLAVRDQLEQSAMKVIEENGGDRLSMGIFSVVNGESIKVTAYLTDPKTRPINTGTMTQRWREATGNIRGLEYIRYQSDSGGPGSGSALTVELTHRDINTLRDASHTLATRLQEFPAVKDIDDGYAAGKEQLNFKMLPEGQSLGLTAYSVARQVRSAFYGIEPIRQQRGRSEIKVRVQYPREYRESESDIEQFLIRTPSGMEIPLNQVAAVERGRSYTKINRRDGHRTVTIAGDVEPDKDTPLVLDALREEILPQLQSDFPGLVWSFQGRQASMRESTDSLKTNFLIALMGIYFLLAIPFRSYTQPAIVMFAIPFGIVGAVLGHMIMGYDLSLVSMMGIVALSGVVINDALILIDNANQRRLEGMDWQESIIQAGARRFRPIMLTTVTTFGGLAPMIFETSRQARFMVPMAISLGYGILFATAITLVFIPTLYLINRDINNGLHQLVQWLKKGF